MELKNSGFGLYLEFGFIFFGLLLYWNGHCTNTHLQDSSIFEEQAT
jgi:hypothetical protein